MVCQDNRLVVEVKQGEDRGFRFTIKENDNPMDLTDWRVYFQVKLVPYFNAPALIDKTITTEALSATREVGYILDQSVETDSSGTITDYLTRGQFKVEITDDETSKLPPKDYALIIFLVNGQAEDTSTKVIISGEGNTSAIFRVCKQ